VNVLGLLTARVLELVKLSVPAKVRGEVIDSVGTQLSRVSEEPGRKVTYEGYMYTVTYPAPGTQTTCTDEPGNMKNGPDPSKKAVFHHSICTVMLPEELNDEVESTLMPVSGEKIAVVPGSSVKLLPWRFRYESKLSVNVVLGSRTKFTSEKVCEDCTFKLPLMVRDSGPPENLNHPPESCMFSTVRLRWLMGTEAPCKLRPKKEVTGQPTMLITFPDRNNATVIVWDSSTDSTDWGDMYTEPFPSKADVAENV